MAGAFVCASLDIVPTVRHADYIGSWLEVLRKDNRIIVRAALRASKAADFILGFLPHVGKHAADDPPDKQKAARCASVAGPDTYPMAT